MPNRRGPRSMPRVQANWYGGYRICQPDQDRYSRGSHVDARVPRTVVRRFRSFADGIALTQSHGRCAALSSWWRVRAIDREPPGIRSSAAVQPPHCPSISYRHAMALHPAETPVRKLPTADLQVRIQGRDRGGLCEATGSLRRHRSCRCKTRCRQSAVAPLPPPSESWPAPGPAAKGRSHGPPMVRRRRSRRAPR